MEKQCTILLVDEALVKKCFDFFAGAEKTLSALELLCSISLLAKEARRIAKRPCSLHFDFNKVGKIRSAELIIMVICVVKAYFAVLAGDVKAAEDAIVAKDAEAAIEEIVNTKFGAEGEDITLAMFNEFVTEEFDQLAESQDDFVNAGAVVLRRFQLEIPGASSAALVDSTSSCC